MWKVVVVFIFWCFIIVECLGQSTVLSPDEIQQLVPARIKGFYRDGDVKGKLMKIGDLHYSLCEHRFVKNNQKVRVLLFDFVDARIMYNQATRDWKNYLPVKNDSITRGPIAIANCAGWESNNRNNNSSQISLGIADRFLLMITGEGVNLETLKIILDQFHFDNFPK